MHMFFPNYLAISEGSFTLEMSPCFPLLKRRQQQCLMMEASMRLVAIAIVLLSTTGEASTMFATNMDCSTVWTDDKHALSNTSGAIRLRLLHHQHPCSSVQHAAANGSLSWHRSRTLERERQLAARLYIHRRRHVPPTNISAPVTSAGASYGFVAQVTIGTPARTQNLLIDTASYFSWVQCEACRRSGTTSAGCFDQDGPIFDPGASTTYRRLPCSSPSCVPAIGDDSAPGFCAVQENNCIYYMQYEDKSRSIGRMGTDTLTFGEETVPGFVFGCSHRYAGRFGRYSGIFGFGNGKISFVSQVVESSGQYRAFSYYLPSPSSVGYIQVGAYDEGGLAFTPMFTKGSDYYLALTGITVNGVPLDLTGGRFSPRTMVTAACYLDLGAALSILPSQVYQSLNDAVAEHIKGYDHVQSSPGCFEPAYLSTERVIPVVRFHFSNGVQLVLDEVKLMFKDADGRLCLGFVPGTVYMLGSMQMQMIYVAQDIDKSRMGFSNN